MGYFRPIDNFNIGKRQEHEDRVRFSEESALMYSMDDEKYTYLINKKVSA